jgi:hypothetical protein
MLPKVSLRYGRYAAEYAGVNRVAKLIMMKSEDDMENVGRILVMDGIGRHRD